MCPIYFILQTFQPEITTWQPAGQIQWAKPSNSARNWIPKLSGSERKYHVFPTIIATEQNNNWDFNIFEYHKHQIIILDQIWFLFDYLSVWLLRKTSSDPCFTGTLEESSTNTRTSSLIVNNISAQNGNCCTLTISSRWKGWTWTM